jgi:hypothetical protein
MGFEALGWLVLSGCFLRPCDLQPSISMSIQRNANLSSYFSKVQPIRAGTGRLNITHSLIRKGMAPDNMTNKKTWH